MNESGIVLRNPDIDQYIIHDHDSIVGSSVMQTTTDINKAKVFFGVEHARRYFLLEIFKKGQLTGARGLTAPLDATFWAGFIPCQVWYVYEQRVWVRS